MKYFTMMLTVCAFPVFAGNVDIVGNVAAKCVIQTDKSGVYGNPTASAGSTWFSIASTATYAASKPFTGGTYVAQVTASCIPA